MRRSDGVSGEGRTFASSEHAYHALFTSRGENVGRVMLSQAPCFTRDLSRLGDVCSKICCREGGEERLKDSRIAGLELRVRYEWFRRQTTSSHTYSWACSSSNRADRTARHRRPPTSPAEPHRVRGNSPGRVRIPDWESSWNGELWLARVANGLRRC